MYPKSSLLSLALTASLAAAHPKGCRTNQNAAATAAKAIYLTTNEAAGNKIVAIPIGQDGKLSGGAAVATGGKGANGIDGSTNQPAFPDPLFSQSALTVAGSSLFAVNAADNTVTMFAIDPRDPTKLTPMGQPAAIAGDFPVTVAASAKNNMVCAGTTGTQAGVSCASFVAGQGMGKFDGLRAFDLGQTNPPVGPTNTLSQLFFSEDEMSLFATVKGDGKDKKGAFAVFPVEANCANGGAAAGQGGQKQQQQQQQQQARNNAAGNGQQGQQQQQPGQATLATQPNLSTPNGSAVLFGSAPIPGTAKGGSMGNVFVTDASFGAGVLTIDDATDATAFAGRTELAGQKATCWAAISPATNTAFVTDVGANRVVEMSTTDASLVAEYDLSSVSQAPGLIDLRAGGNFVYALAPGNGTTPATVMVMDVSAGAGKAQVVQAFDVTGLGAGKNSQGMAILV